MDTAQRQRKRHADTVAKAFKEAGLECFQPSGDIARLFKTALMLVEPNLTFSGTSPSNLSAPHTSLEAHFMVFAKYSDSANVVVMALITAKDGFTAPYYFAYDRETRTPHAMTPIHDFVKALKKYPGRKTRENIFDAVVDCQRPVSILSAIRAGSTSELSPQNFG